MTVKIAPSILSADFSKLGEEIKAIDKAGCDYIHIDVMDGHFVPNLTIGPCVIKDIRKCTEKTFDVHLMMEHPDSFIEAFAKAGSDIITIHAEADCPVKQTLQKIRSLGKKSGISIRPQTSYKVIEPLLEELDLILVMTVNPGFGGQAFMPDQLTKISDIKKLLGTKNIELEIDGGINKDTAPACISAGADVLVAGSAVFCTPDYETNIKQIRGG